MTKALIFKVRDPPRFCKVAQYAHASQKPAPKAMFRVCRKQQGHLQKVLGLSRMCPRLNRAQPSQMTGPPNSVQSSAQASIL